MQQKNYTHTHYTILYLDITKRSVIHIEVNNKAEYAF